MTSENTDTLRLLLYLHSLGEVVPLKLDIDLKPFFRELAAFEKNWVEYNPNPDKRNFRWGLSLTSLDGGLSGDPDLYSLKEYNEAHKTAYREDQFITKTPVYTHCKELHEPLEPLGPLGRSHLLRLGRGGYFPPHRDTAQLNPECFRVIANLNFSQNYFSFVLNGQELKLEPGRLYLMNTTLSHSLSSFNDYSHFLVLNLPLQEDAVERINGLLYQY